MKTLAIIAAIVVGGRVLSAQVTDQVGRLDPDQARTLENWYGGQAAAIKAQAIEYAKTVSVQDRALWTEFYRAHAGLNSPAGSFFYTAGTFVSEEDSIGKYVRMIDSIYTEAFANFLLDENALRLVRQVRTDPGQPLGFRLYSQRLAPKMEFFQSQAAALTRARAIRLLEFQKPVAHSTDKLPARPKDGIINAISWSKSEAFADIEGVDGIVRQGDIIAVGTLKGYRVDEITPGAVVLQNTNRRIVLKIENSI